MMDLSNANPHLLRLLLYLVGVCVLSVPVYYIFTGRLAEKLGAVKPTTAALLSVVAFVVLVFLLWFVLTGRLLALAIEIGSRLP